MTRVPRLLPPAAALLAGLSLLACGPRPATEAGRPGGAPDPAPPAAESVRLEIGHCPEGEETALVAATSFAPADAICASVTPAGAAGTALRLRLVGDGDPAVDQEIDLAADAGSGGVGRFERPGGWPPGAYRLSVLGGESELAARQLEVRAEAEPHAQVPA